MTFRRAGWILVGGQSTRMGRDKALLQLHSDQPLALREAEILQPLTGTVTLVGDPGKYGSLGLPVIPDLRQGYGPLAGIEAALTATTADWNIIIACDLPGIQLGMLTKLFGLTDGADAVVPRHASGKIEPLCALYHRRALPTVRQLLDEGTRRVTDAVSALTVRYLPVADEQAFRNLNTPDDISRFREQYQERHGNG